MDSSPILTIEGTSYTSLGYKCFVVWFNSSGDIQRDSLHEDLLCKISTTIGSQTVELSNDELDYIAKSYPNRKGFWTGDIVEFRQILKAVIRAHEQKQNK